MKILSEIKYEYKEGNKIILHFKNYITNEEYSKEYNTRRGAKIAEEKFHKKVSQDVMNESIRAENQLWFFCAGYLHF